MCSANGNFAFGLVEISFVWYCFATLPRAGMMHCTSTIIASTTPVAMASSC